MSADASGENVEEGCLAGAGAAADDDVQMRLDAGGQETGDGLSECAEADEIVHAEASAAEFSDGDAGAGDCDGWDDHVYAGAIREAGIDQQVVGVEALAEGF